jgi:hypothetical protein
MNQYDPHTVYLIFGPNTKVCLVSDVRDAIEKHRKSLEADNPESSTLGHETYDDELYAIFGAPAKPAQEPVTKQYDGTEHMKELLGIAPPEAPISKQEEVLHRKEPAPYDAPEAVRRWRCKGCGKTVREQSIDRNMTTGVMEHWNDWHASQADARGPGWCGPVVEDAGSAGGGV